MTYQFDGVIHECEQSLKQFICISKDEKGEWITGIEGGTDVMYIHYCPFCGIELI
jgi:hypothetical protein